MMPLMLEACRSFADKWREFLEYWSDEPEPPLYMALSDLARHLIGLLEQRDVSSFPKVFNVLERWHVEGDSYVKEAATAGLLEDLQNANLHDGTDPEQFRPYLLPASAKWWDRLCGFWDRGEFLQDD